MIESALRKIGLPSRLYLSICIVLTIFVIWEVVFNNGTLYMTTSDIWEQVAAVFVWLEHPFNPPNPQIDSPTSSPRFIPHYFPFILIGSLLGWDAITVIDAVSVWNFALLLGGIYILMRLLFDDPWAPSIALVPLLAFWDNPWFYSGVFELSVLLRILSYASISGFVVAIWVFCFLVWTLRQGKFEKWQGALLSLGVAYVVATHVLTGAFVVGSCGLYILTRRTMPIRGRLIWSAITLSGVFLAMAWPFYPVNSIFQTTGEGFNQWGLSPMGLSGRLEYIGNHAFYGTYRAWQSFWPAIPGLFAAIYFAVQKREFFFLSAALAFIAVWAINIVVNVPLGHRFAIYSIFWAQVSATGVLVIAINWAARKARLSARSMPLYLLAGLVGIFSISIYFSTQRVGDRLMRVPGEAIFASRAGGDVYRANLQVLELTQRDDIIAGEANTTWMLPGMGRRLLAPKRMQPLVPDRRLRRASQNMLLSAEVPRDIKNQIIAYWSVDYILFSTSSRYTARNRELEEFLPIIRDYAVEEIPVTDAYSLFVMPTVELEALDHDAFLSLVQPHIEALPPGRI